MRFVTAAFIYVPVAPGKRERFRIQQRDQPPVRIKIGRATSTISSIKR
jgi:hypothetical protein